MEAATALGPTEAQRDAWRDADHAARPARLERLRERLASEGIDAYFGVRPENSRYLTGFALGDGEEKVAGSSGRFLVSADETIVLADSRYRLQAEEQCPTTRVEPIGVSLGAPFMTIAGALDERLSRVWVLHGSGGSYVPLEANMKRNIPIAPVRALAAGIANVIINGPNLDPVHWVDRIAPRPFMMVNASDDERLPRRAVDALYASAREPKEIVWMSGRHVHSDRETIQRLVGIVMSRMRGEPRSSASD